MTDDDKPVVIIPFGLSHEQWDKLEGSKEAGKRGAAGCLLQLIAVLAVVLALAVTNLFYMR